MITQVSKMLTKRSLLFRISLMKEPLRYLNNAKEILRNAPIEDNNYTDIIVSSIT
ncbi:MAG: hypothetical protein AB1397_00575 [bacterium]